MFIYFCFFETELRLARAPSAEDVAELLFLLLPLTWLLVPISVACFTSHNDFQFCPSVCKCHIFTIFLYDCAKSMTTCNTSCIAHCPVQELSSSSYGLDSRVCEAQDGTLHLVCKLNCIMGLTYWGEFYALCLGSPTVSSWKAT